MQQWMTISTWSRGWDVNYHGQRVPMRTQAQFGIGLSGEGLWDALKNDDVPNGN